MDEEPPVTPVTMHSPDGAFQTGKPRGLGDFVALHPRCGANRIERAFALDLRLEIDEWRLAIERKPALLQRLAGQMLNQPAGPSTIDLRVRLRHCYVRYRCDGVAIRADSKYRSAVEIGTYSERQAASDRTATARDRTAHLDLASSLKSQPTASASAGYRVGSSWHGSASVERTITASQDLYEVEAVPGGWRVGDRTHGDPVKRDGCLDGLYFDRPVEGRPQTCIVEFLPDSTEGAIDFAVTTRDGLRVETIDGETAPKGDHDLAVAAMRDRLAAICIERATIDAGHDELVLFEIPVTCSMASEPVDTPDGRGHA